MRHRLADFIRERACLNEGKLYVARFNADGSGEWIELTISDSRIAAYNKDGFSFTSQAASSFASSGCADCVGTVR